jgi:hypothetical protein
VQLPIAIRRLEGMIGPLAGAEETKGKIIAALEHAGIVFSERSVRLK